MKKILLLGGSSQQIVAIYEAKKLGYFTIVCDYLKDNPGQFVADKFFLASTTDKDRILQIATDEKIDGIIAYASDPAAPTAAFVAEILHLPSNPYSSVDTLCNKDKFRLYLAKNGFSVPTVYKDIESVNKFPVIIKPVDSSGSKGVTVINNKAELKSAYDFALSFSRCGRVIIEDFVIKNHEYLIGGDIFILGGEIKIWGLLNCHRDASLNPLVPVGKSYPLALSERQIQIAKKTLKDLVRKLGISFGPMNVELVIDEKENCYVIDAGPRAGGNMIPDFLGMLFNVNIVQMCIKCAMGESVDVSPSEKKQFYATHNLHSNIGGIYKNIVFDEQISPYIIKKYFYKKEGDVVEPFYNASNALGIIFLKFNRKDEMEILKDINSHYKVEMREEAENEQEGNRRIFRN